MATYFLSKNKLITSIYTMSHKRPYFELIQLDNLYLDEHNPRLPKSLQSATEVEILEYMLLDASLIELMLAIGKNDFFTPELRI